MGRGIEETTPGDEIERTLPPEALGQIALVTASDKQPDDEDGEYLDHVASDCSEVPPETGQISWKGKTLGPEHVETLYRIYRDAIRRYIFHKLGDDEAADTFTQDTFVKAHDRLCNSRLEPVVLMGDTPSGWIYSIAKGLIIDELRRRQRKVKILSYDEITSATITSGAGYEPGRALAAAEADMTGFEDSVIKSMEAQNVLNSMNREHQAHMRALILYHIYGFGYKEIAEILGITESGVKMFLSRARAEFRETYHRLDTTA